ncbi:YceI family protein [Frankia sp. Cppng1_Ct_nod]|uniref:YceI family protein n=1 Tax=Frankia sp. Cppng1_Ct_nod TaxID=2897162 RepID=UPI0010415707|nr:YceI family protein [Frankia sp. Cppng1_Ct_nod]
MSTSGASLERLTGSWMIDPDHSLLGFAVRHAMVTTVRGSFRSFEGTLHLNGSEPTASTAMAVIHTASIDTGNTDRDNHLRSPDFLDVEKYPTITFDSMNMKIGDKPDVYLVTGDLTIRGTTRAVDVVVEFQGSAVDPFGNTRAGFTGSTAISRKEFGLTWNAVLETGGVLLGDKVGIELDISAIRAS